MASNYIRKKPVTWILWILKWMSWIVDHIPFTTMRKKPTVDEICKEAQKQTGLSCFGDNPIWRGCLESYFDDLYEHKDSNHLSRFIVRKESTKRVVQRLRVLNAFKEYPQALELELPSPIFVVGLPRTGSTFLHQCNINI